MAPQTAFRAVSKQNTLKAAQRILKDAEVIVPHIPCQKHATNEFQLDADGYYDIDAGHVGLLSKDSYFSRPSRLGARLLPLRSAECFC